MSNSKHQSDTASGRLPGNGNQADGRQRGPGDSVVGSQALLATEHPEILDADGGLAIDGGKLPGKHDDFDGEIDQNRAVPGANGEGGVKPPNDQDIRQ